MTFVRIVKKVDIVIWSIPKKTNSPVRETLCEIILRKHIEKTMLFGLQTLHIYCRLLNSKVFKKMTGNCILNWIRQWSPLVAIMINYSRLEGFFLKTEISDSVPKIKFSKVFQKSRESGYF